MDGWRAVAAGWVSLVAVFAAAGALFPPPAAKLPPAQPSEAATPAPPASSSPLSSGPALRLLGADGAVATLELEDYLRGVLAAEMPASFPPAALEAQAVAARTYALRRAEAGPHSPQADLCADPGCCQGYDPAGADDPRLRAAVAATSGEVLTMDGQLIDAVFHASSVGSTAPAQAVWGAAVPYLVSVSTPERADTVDDLQAQVSFTTQELAQRLGSGQIGQARYYDWGGVDTLEVGDGVLSGQEVRQRLGLRSARFTLSKQGDQVVFTTSGYGHGVGMSQRGAQLMAQAGSGYREILAHYYPGTTLETGYGGS